MVITICFYRLYQCGAIRKFSIKAPAIFGIDDIPGKLPERIGIICQSTSIQSQFEKIADYLKSNTNVIGISAGASTPPWIIDDVEDAIKTIIFH